MSNSSRFPVLSGLLLFSWFTVVLFVSSVNADPSERVGYLSDSHGLVSYSPSGEDLWIDVVRNRPLIRGDRLWTDRDALAEFQVGSSAVRIDENSSVEILDLNDRMAQLQLTQGSLSLSVRRMYTDQQIEIDTPMLAFVISNRGRYRIDVDPEFGETTIVVWEGRGEVYGEHANFSLRAGDMVRFYDDNLQDYKMYGLPREDNFDRYSRRRDDRFQRVESLRYVEDDLVGYSALDEYGSWHPVSSHGHVWFPSRISANWAPYRDGHWVWQEPWGWTWVDNAPWGFAPSHYGRWVYVRNSWGWVPGPRRSRSIYAPALVAFIGGSGWSLSLSLGGNASPIGWFPLGPREVYVPSYHVSRDYFTRVNVNNTVIQNTTITNVYNNYYSSDGVNIDHINYTNRHIERAVTVVPHNVFVNAKPVRSAAMHVDRKAITTGETMRIAPIAPSKHSVIGSGGAAKSRPAMKVFDRKVVARNAPPPADSPFAQREKFLQKQPGRALESAVVETAQGNTGKRSRNIRVLGEQQNAVDVRTSGSRRGGDATQPQQTLDRAVEPKRRHDLGKSVNDKPTTQQRQEQSPLDVGSDRKAAQQPLQRKADSDRPEVQQRQEQSPRDVGSDRKATQHQEQLQRKADSDQRNGKVEQPRTDEPARKKESKRPKSKRQVECEREAHRLQQDLSRCLDLD